MCHKNDAVHRGPRCWHDDPNGLWEERCGLDSLRSEDTLGLLWKHPKGGNRVKCTKNYRHSKKRSESKRVRRRRERAVNERKSLITR